MDTYQLFKKLVWVRLALFLLALSLSFYSLWGLWTLSSIVEQPEIIADDLRLPKRYFQQSSHFYDSLGGGSLALKSGVSEPTLPDLRREIVYYGLNGRPDAKVDGIVGHVMLAASEESKDVREGEKIFLQVQSKSGALSYHFSPNNEVTPLSFELIPGEREATFTLCLVDDDGVQVKEPQELSQFILKKQDPLRARRTMWSLGNFRVDGGLFARQRMRWFGRDCFFDQHGGQEFEQYKNRQRIDVQDQNTPYSLFVSEGDFLIWKDDRWQAVLDGERTEDYPLLVLSKVDDRVMQFELWSEDGSIRVSLNLMRSHDSWNPKMVERDFRYVGDRTRSQFLLEIGSERISVQPDEWFLQTESGWKKISTVEEIDAYVAGDLRGALLALEGQNKGSQGQRAIKAHVFNPTRTEIYQILLNQNTAAKTVDQETFESLSSVPFSREMIEEGADIGELKSEEVQEELEKRLPKRRKRGLKLPQLVQGTVEESSE
ncbi:MAG: hypothetical protein CMO81_04605 [Waddliaceae bacterium]|nr:hypothetical protein [Waddliaceae bacterium]